jgi:transposase
MSDGSMKVTETATLRVTYGQDWRAYNLAQTHEKQHVLEMLHSLCASLTEPPQIGRGERRLPLSDRAFAIVAKVYGGMSTRRTLTDMREYEAKGLLSHAPSWNSIIDYMDEPGMIEVMSRLIEETAAPLADIEHTIAVDGSGFTTVNWRRWVDHKYGKQHNDSIWIKGHFGVGVRTGIITSAVVTDGSVNDSPQLPAIIQATARNFMVEEVLADKGYHGHPNSHAIDAIGAKGFIPFKNNSTGTGKHGGTGPASELWKRLYAFWMYQRPAFLAHYNKRSNVESTFSAIKRLFGPGLRSKTRRPQEVELLAKCVAFNLTVLTHAIYELGITPSFWQNDVPKNTDAMSPLPLSPARQNDAPHDGNDQ